MLPAGAIIGYIVLAVVGIFVLIVLIDLGRKVVVISKGTAMVVERFGKFHCVLYEGLHFLMPFADYARVVRWRTTETHLSGNKQVVSFTASRVRRIDLREQVFDFVAQPIITRDNVEIYVHPMLLFQLVDPIKVCYATADLTSCVEKLVTTTLRSIIGDMGLDDTLASREEINRAVLHKVSNVCLDWGMQVNQVEVLEIQPTSSIQEAMHKQLSAERIRRAAIVTAEGYREQVRTEAEGSAQAAIAISNGEAAVMRLKAEGVAKSKELLADAEASAVEAVASMLELCGVEPSQYLIAMRYLEAFAQMSQSAAKRHIIFPFEAQLHGATRDLRPPG